MQRFPLGQPRMPESHPAPKVRPEFFDLSAPDARNGGRQILLVLLGKRVQDPVQRIKQLIQSCPWPLTPLLKEVELDSVKQSPTRKRVQLLQRVHGFTRSQTINSIQVKLVGACGKMLEARSSGDGVGESAGSQHFAQ